MQLKELFPNSLNANSKISSIELDSRLVKNGSIFFALKGLVTDGEKFIDSALEKGAIAIICNSNCQNNNQRIIKVDNVYEVLISSLQKLYNNLPENILAITGTNGKTSIAYFTAQIQEILGKKSASIGTIGIKVNDPEIQKELTTFSLTTPDIASLYKNLAILKQNGINDVVIETSSIGLEQKRIAGVRVKLGAFSNFTQDHLDYHGSMEKYFDCKMLLFKEVLKADDIAILNADIVEFENMKEISLKQKLRVFSYSSNQNNAIKSDISASINNEEIRIFDKKYPFKITLAGDFQKANLICALLSVVAHYELSESQIAFIIKNLNQIKPAEGRMQKVGQLKNDAQIFIDYAHTPDALLNVLQTAKKMSHNNLRILFGCGGNRDKTKRQEMGKIACDLADFVIVSDDNPREENAGEIRKEILSACDLSKSIEIGDRKEAIIYAMSELKNDDILILAGKGHEKYQVIGTENIELDEEKIVEEFLKDNLI
ncbi:MAG: UDP-N-acetylmuramoyl-L-alanyl-D-glutamate--2,6-diaminopimelate ligase [Rickettsiales bacterium]|jgi:UDP-N-acetylmuramoyl-L-alanyl-D-glutamate--2,6-diaminopimelate ligase